MWPQVAVRCARSISVKLLQQFLAALILQLVHLHPDLHQLQLHLLLSILLVLACCPAPPDVAQGAVNRAQQELMLSW